jgi:SAM-dependent methyltransferase
LGAIEYRPAKEPQAEGQPIRMGRVKAGSFRKRSVVRLIRSCTPAGGKVLEISCGDGRHLLPLVEAGFHVRGTNFSKYDDEAPGLPVDHGVDLRQGLPHEAGSFDTVVLVDVIEHLSDHNRAVAELARVCREGGHVIVLSPNIMKLNSRLQFLLTGLHKLKRDFVGFDVAPDRAFTFHNHPPHLPTFLYQMRSHGLRLSAFTAEGYKWRSLVPWVLLGPLVWIATAAKVHVSEPNLRGTDAAGEIRRCLTSFAGMCGEFWIAVARKDSSPVAPRTKLPPWATTWRDSAG